MRGASEGREPEQPPRILYIMGPARSGSTILEVLLANVPGVLGAGEITHIFADGFGRGTACACGHGIAECPVWRGLAARFDAAGATRAADCCARLDRHGALLRRLVGTPDAQALNEYREINDATFAALAETTGAAWIVDSSKYAARALALADCFPDRVRVLCLTRTPAGIMASFQKPNPDEQLPKSPVRALVYYAAVLASLRVALRRLGDRARWITYEDLLARPTQTLADLGEWCDLDTGVVAAAIARGDALDVGHIVTGNRLRKQGRVHLDLRERTPEVRGLGARIAVALMDAWRRLLGF